MYPDRVMAMFVRGRNGLSAVAAEDARVGSMDLKVYEAVRLRAYVQMEPFKEPLEEYNIRVDAVEVDTVLRWGGCRVTLHQHGAGAAVLGFGGAVAQQMRPQTSP